MTKEEIIQNNVLIAEFMGTEIKVKSSADPYKYQVYGGQWQKEGLKYDYDWNWLMDVVEKIERTFESKQFLPRLDINSHNSHYAINPSIHPEVKSRFSCTVGCFQESPEKIKFDSKIEAVYYVAIEFIKWYNQNKKQ